MHSRHLLYLQANTTALIFSITGSSRDFCSNLLNVRLDYRFAFIQPFSPPPTASKETFWNVNPIMLLLGLKAFWLLGLAFCLPSVSASSFVPFTIHLVAAAHVCEVPLWSVPFHMLPETPGITQIPPSLHNPVLHLFLQEVFGLPQAEFVDSLCCHIALFMRSVSLGLPFLFELQIFYSCCILFSGTGLNCIDTTGGKVQNSCAHGAPSTEGRSDSKQIY